MFDILWLDSREICFDKVYAGLLIAKVFFDKSIVRGVGDFKSILCVFLSMLLFY